MKGEEAKFKQYIRRQTQGEADTRESTFDQTTGARESTFDQTKAARDSTEGEADKGESAID